jgi:hypothetical protein
MNTLLPHFYRIDECIVDVLTNCGISPLLFTGLFKEASLDRPYAISARLTKSGNLVLVHTLCQRPEMEDSYLQFLLGRGVYWHSNFELWQWAVSHHWPSADSLFLECRKWRQEGKFHAIDAVITDDESSIQSSITLNGTYDFNNCFSLNQLIIAWDPICGCFRFPRIDDYRTLQACIRLLDSRDATFVAHNPLECQQLLGKVRGLATMRGWPQIQECLDRIQLWEDVRPQLPD